MTKTVYQHTDHVDWMVGADKTITLKDTEADWFFKLNPVATLIWDLLDGTSTEGEIVNSVLENFAIDEETARRDVIDFIEQAVDLNLIETEEVL